MRRRGKNKLFCSCCCCCCGGASARLHVESFVARLEAKLFSFLPPPLLHPGSRQCAAASPGALVAQHGIRESELYQLIHLRGSARAAQ